MKQSYQKPEANVYLIQAKLPLLIAGSHEDYGEAEEQDWD